MSFSRYKILIFLTILINSIYASSDKNDYTTKLINDKILL